MNILYSIQATGNGHISRAMELLPHLQNYGSVDLFLSGSNSNLPLNAPVKYRSRGLSLFYNCSGGLNYWKMMKSFQPWQLRREIRELPVEKYDLIINDFEHITAAACALKNIPSVNYGHQASFMSANTPRPDQVNRTGEFILRNYAKASRYVGLHFQPYDDFIFTPVIKNDILKAQPTDKGHITVYLPAYCEKQLNEIFTPLTDYRFEIFSGETKTVRRAEHIQWLPVNKHLFNNRLIHCHAIICGAGFETPAEALHLQKKIMAIPIRSQYEQQCNAAALRKMGISTLEKIDNQFKEKMEHWLQQRQHIRVDYRNSIAESIRVVLDSK